MLDNLVKYNHAKTIHEAFMFPRLYDVFSTVLSLAFIKGDNRKATVSHDVLKKIDLELSNCLMKSFGGLFYFLPDQQNNLVSAAQYMRQKDLVYFDISEYFTLFQKLDYFEKMEWYKDNTIKDIAYRGKMDELVKQLSELEKSKIEHIEKESSLKINFYKNEVINFQNLCEGLKVQIKTYDKEIVTLNKQIETSNAKIQELELEIKKMVNERDILSNELKNEVVTVKCPHADNVSSSDIDVTKLWRVDVYNKYIAKRVVDDKRNYFKKIGVEWGGKVCLWNVDYNNIIDKLNQMIAINENVFDTFKQEVEDCLNQCSNKILSRLSHLLNLSVSSWFKTEF